MALAAKQVKFELLKRKHPVQFQVRDSPKKITADLLSDGQKECLRLVLAHLNSKEIGRKIGVSPHTVDQRLRKAMHLLNVNTRFEAARKFVELEQIDLYQPLIYQSPDIEVDENSVTLGTSIKQGEHGNGSLVKDDLAGEPAKPDSSNFDMVGSSALSIDERSSTKAERRFRLPYPRTRGEKNKLGSFERLGWVWVIAIGSALSFGGILAGLEALSRLNG